MKRFYLIALVACVSSGALAEQPPEFVGQWGQCGQGAGQFLQEAIPAVGPDGLVYVADPLNFRVQKFDSSGNFVAAWGWGVRSGAAQYEICEDPASCGPGIEGSGDGQFDYPSGIAVDADGEVFVADRHANQIQKFSSDGTFITSWGTWCCGGESAFQFPRDLDIDSTGHVYVADQGQHRIQKFDNDGNFVSMWGWGVSTGTAQYEVCYADCTFAISGPGDGQFQEPTGVAVDQDGYVYVADWRNKRIQKFESDGHYIAQWSANIGELLYVAVDSDGSIYSEDRNLHRVVKFDPYGNLLSQWGSYGSDPGQFKSPWGIAAAGDLIYVGDAGSNCRIQIFGDVSPRISCNGFEPPMADYPVTVKKNRALPLKAELFDDEGYSVMEADISAPPVVQVWFDSGSGGDAIDVTDQVLSVGQGDDGNQFVFTDNNRWQFNLSTKNYVAPGTYTVLMASGDESEYVLDPSCLTEFVIQ